MALEIAGFGLEESLPYVGVSILDTVLALISLCVGIIVVKLITGYIKDWMLSSGLNEILAGFTSRLVSIFLYILVVLVSLTFLGLEMGVLLVSVVAVLGFVVGFALQDTFSSIAAGFMLAVVKPFEKGDYVKVNGETGIVKGVGISITSIDTKNNERIVIPNGEIWGGNITNFTEHSARRLDMETGVSYDDDLDKVIRVTMDLLKEDDRVLSEPKPQVAVKEMGDSAIVLAVRPWVKQEDYWKFYYDFQKTVKQKYDEEGISMPYPHMDVTLLGESGE